MSRRPRILYISLAPARDGTSGSLLLHRHFTLLGNRFEIHRAHEDPSLPGEENYTQLPPRPLHDRLMRSRLVRLAERLENTRGFFHSRRALRAIIDRVRPDIIVTIAEGTLYMPVRSLALARDIPLVTFFHDWSPSWPGVPAACRPGAEATFRRAYRDSAVSFCVCDEIRDALGGHPNAPILHPIPNPNPAPVAADTSAGIPFHALYAGVFHTLYAAEMKALCRELVRARATNLLRIIGPDPGWPAEDARPLCEHNIYHGFQKAGLPTWLAAAPAHLVISSFEPGFEDYSRYSFPSKIPEYCRYGRPLVIWGPAHAASVRWARRTDAGLVVDNPDPAALVAALRDLAAAPERRAALARHTARLAETTFQPARLQSVFEAGLHAALAGNRSAAV